MPAIYLDKLKLQSANLAGKFGQSDEFMDDLLELFEFYSDRTFRAGNNTLAGRLHISYHLPERVFWQIERDLETQINIFPQEHALRLAGLLWTGESLEEKKLAVFILGRTSVSPSQPVLETYRNWFEQEDDSYLRQELVANGLLRLRREAFAIWLPLVQEWVTGRNEQFLGQDTLPWRSTSAKPATGRFPPSSASSAPLCWMYPRRTTPNCSASFASCLRLHRWKRFTCFRRSLPQPIRAAPDRKESSVKWFKSFRHNTGNQSRSHSWRNFVKKLPILMKWIYIRDE